MCFYLLVWVRVLHVVHDNLFVNNTTNNISKLSKISQATSACGILDNVKYCKPVLLTNTTYNSCYYYVLFIIHEGKFLTWVGFVLKRLSNQVLFSTQLHSRKVVCFQYLWTLRDNDIIIEMPTFVHMLYDIHLCKRCLPSSFFNANCCIMNVFAQSFKDGRICQN